MTRSTTTSHEERPPDRSPTGESGGHPSGPVRKWRDPKQDPDGLGPITERLRQRREDQAPPPE